VLVFNAFGRAAQSSAAVAFVITNQSPDGGFGDIIRTHPGASDALDTAWAAITLQEVQPSPLFSSFLAPVLFVGIIVAVGVVAVVGVVVAYLLLKRRACRPTS
jgi:hypothetical protein